MFDTKMAVVVREDLATWQKLNVVAFLTSGVVGANPGLLGEPYEDAAGNLYNPLLIQPTIVLSAQAPCAHHAADYAANRATVKQYAPDAMNVVGLALRDDKKVVDKITKGARMHA